MLTHQYSRQLDSAEETSRYARSLGTALIAGDVVLLEGAVGAGKSHFARSLILSLLDEPEDVPSPTFTLVQTYETHSFVLWHADLYRLTDIREIEELGLIDAFETAICLIEWPDRLGEFDPPCALTLRFEDGQNEDSRVMTARWQDPKWTTKLDGWFR